MCTACADTVDAQESQAGSPRLCGGLHRLVVLEADSEKGKPAAKELRIPRPGSGVGGIVTA